MEHDPLSNWRVVMGCPTSWGKMAGDDRVRHCSLCDRKVYNLSAMTREEALTLLRQSEGRVCARYYRRADGTIMTRDCGWKAKVRARTFTTISALGAAALAAVGLFTSLASRPTAMMGEVGPAPVKEPPKSTHPVPVPVAPEPEGMIVGEMAVPMPAPELRQEIERLNRKIQTAKDRETRRQYAEERQALVEELRRSQA
jgi:hypothetical protein